MDVELLTLLRLVVSGLTETKIDSVPHQLDWTRILQIAEYQGIISIVYHAIRLSKINVPEEILIKFKLGFFNEVRISQYQLQELSKLFASFEQNQIDYLPLKGTVMKDYYPKPEYRWMSDADIVIRLEQYEQITQIMKMSGYSFIYESKHELNWKKEKFIIEFHKTVFDPSYEKYVHSFENIFEGAVREGESHKYRMESTDELVYSVAHLAKHILVSGARLRSLIDIYYIIQKWDRSIPELEKVLSQVGLYSFYQLISKALDQWFANEDLDKESSVLFESVLNESMESHKDRYTVLREVNNEKRNAAGVFSHRLKVVFPPRQLLQRRFSVLRKAPFLLPFFWIWRGIDGVLFHRSRIKRILTLQYSNERDVAIDSLLNQIKDLKLDNMVIPEDI